MHAVILSFNFISLGFECNGGVLEEEVTLPLETTADQEVPREAVLQAPGEFDFNEFFNLDKSVPGLASVSGIE